MKYTLNQSSLVQSTWSLAHCNLLAIFSGRSCGFLKQTKLSKPTSSIRLYTVDLDIESARALLMLVQILLNESNRPFFTAKVMAWSVVKEVDRGRPDLDLDSNVPLSKVFSTAPFDMVKVLAILRTERPSMLLTNLMMEYFPFSELLKMCHQLKK